METAAFQVRRSAGACRARLRGKVDTAGLDAVLRLTDGGEGLSLDLHDAHLTPAAITALTRLAGVRPDVRVQPEGLLGPWRGRRPLAPPGGDITAVLAHELRSPISLVHARLQVLEQSLTAERRASLADACRRSIDDLTKTMRVIELCLTAAQPWELAPVPLGDLARQGLAAAADLPEAAGVALRLEVEGEPVAYGYPRALQLLLHNLLLNALQACGRAGTVRVRVAAGTGRVSLTVADSGPGFPAAMLQEPFVAYRTDRRRGIGLGLVICKWITDRHDGQIELANAGGAMVTVTLPSAPVAPPGPVA